MPKENLGFMASCTALEQSPLHARQPEGSKPGSPAAHDLGITQGPGPQSGLRLAGLMVGHFGSPLSNATLSLLSSERRERERDHDAASAHRARDLGRSFLDGTVTRFFVGRHGNGGGLILGVLRGRSR